MARQQKPARRIGIMGGTFDPIHYGHLVTAEAVRFEFGLDKVIFVPSGRPPHKKACLVTPAHHRHMMAVLATASNPLFEVSRIEIERPGYSYTVDTIREFWVEYQGKVDLYFITGADAVREILTWKEIEKIGFLCQFVAASRPGFNLGGSALASGAGRLDELADRPNFRIQTLEVPALAISSSDIRQRIKKGKPVKYLLPETVENYLVEHSLYK